MTRLCIALAVCLLVALQIAAGAAPGDSIYARPGRLVSVNGTRLNFYCMGSGSPAVIFDSGWEDWAPAWAVVQPRVARFTRACAYDRAGAGFSDAGPMPRTSVRIADELRGALHNARVAGPYILVGSAFGGDNVRTFADRYTPEVAGLVLDEADADDLVPTDMQQDDHRGEVQIVAQLRACRNAVAHHKPLPLLPPRPGSSRRTCAQQFFRGLPEAVWSPQLNAVLLHLAQTKVAMYDAYISEMEEVPRDEAYLKQHRRSLGSRPVIVISTGNHGVGSLARLRAPTLEHLRYEYENALAQSRWLRLSSNSKQIFATKSSEYVQFDEPNTVVEAIRQAYESSVKHVSNSALRDCAVCPEMVTLPAGSFVMGSPRSEKLWAARHGLSLPAVADEAPQHRVWLTAFALGRYDVTRAQYAAFVRDTKYSSPDTCGHDSFNWKQKPGLSWRNPGFRQSERDPVVCVSWRDAQAYVVWLRDKTHLQYRLPSESEWEYATRAGTVTKFWWGDDAGRAATFAWFKPGLAAHFAWHNSSFAGRTYPVGMKLPNRFGLYDMVGNVWQWTLDCYAGSYAGAPNDGRPVEKDNCSLRSDRGGSWLYPVALLRSAARERNPADFRDAIMGFRVAKTLAK
jgi:formylglycine-generating enzyme required for sulfatase activity